MTELPTIMPGERNDISIRLACAIAGEAGKLVKEHLPDLREMFLVEHKIRFQELFADGWFALRVIFDPRMSMMVGPLMDPPDAEHLRSLITGEGFRDPEELRRLLGPDWVGPDRFTYVGPYEGDRMSWPDVGKHIVGWLNAVAIPDVLDRNRTRVMRAIPTPPDYDVGHISDSLWVLECEKDCLQGTAFSLEGVGLVTCDHVLGAATAAFRHDAPERRFPVRVRARHHVLDLAVLEIDAASPRTLERGDPSRLAQMDHLLVAGHPNYRQGDSPLVAPGIVVGFRPASGIRRILTNAAIVAGGSGGPVLDREGKVVGVAVTGAESLGEVGDTEDLGIVPIDAMDILLGSGG